MRVASFFLRIRLLRSIGYDPQCTILGGSEFKIVQCMQIPLKNTKLGSGGIRTHLGSRLKEPERRTAAEFDQCRSAQAHPNPQWQGAFKSAGAGASVMVRFVIGSLGGGGGSSFFLLRLFLGGGGSRSLCLLRLFLLGGGGDGGLCLPRFFVLLLLLLLGGGGDCSSDLLSPSLGSHL